MYAWFKKHLIWLILSRTMIYLSNESINCVTFCEYIIRWMNHNIHFSKNKQSNGTKHYQTYHSNYCTMKSLIWRFTFITGFLTLRTALLFFCFTLTPFCFTWLLSIFASRIVARRWKTTLITWFSGTTRSNKWIFVWLLANIFGTQTIIFIDYPTQGLQQTSLFGTILFFGFANELLPFSFDLFLSPIQLLVAIQNIFWQLYFREVSGSTNQILSNCAWLTF